MISSLRHKSFYPWLVVALLWGVALLNYMDRQMLSTMREAMQVDIPQLQRAETFGVLMAVFLYIYGLMSPIAGIVADRSNRKWLIVGSLFVWSAVTYGMGMAHDYTTLLVLRAIMGFSEALYIPTALSLIADYHTGKNRSLAIGLHMTGLYTGQALGGFGATIAASKGWHTAFHWFGIIGICYALLLAVLLLEKKHGPSTDERTSEDQLPLSKSLLLLFSNVAFWILLFYFAAPSLPGWAIKNWLPTLFADSLNIPMASAGPLSTITIAISSFIGMGAKTYPRSHLYQCHWPWTDYTGFIVFRVRSDPTCSCGGGSLFWNWLWYFRCQQYAYSLPGCSQKFAGNRLWLYEYGRCICWSCHHTMAGKI